MCYSSTCNTIILEVISMDSLNSLELVFVISVSLVGVLAMLLLFYISFAEKDVIDLYIDSSKLAESYKKLMVNWFQSIGQKK